ncbi:MAG: hypothetical protein HQQ73_10285 [Desulfobulbaceae bacterium]|nr:hypothetical protein [Desulfobulbaceae bacterium]
MIFKKKSENLLKDLVYQEWWKKISHHLGAIYPFYDIDFPDQFSLDITDIIKQRRNRDLPVDLDPVGLACKVCLPYMLGDRTLVQGVRRAPWVYHYDNDGRFSIAELPLHGYKRPDPDVYTQLLKDALLDEAADYVNGARKVGILLSGGMDSRIVAGIIRSLQISTDSPKYVVAITWGASDSRDVVYARMIAERFNWEVQNISLNANVLAAC